MEINVDDGELSNFITQYVKRRIDQKIGDYLQFQLRGAVEAKLAEMRLLDVKSPTLTTTVDSILEQRIEQAADQAVRKALMKVIKS